MKINRTVTTYMDAADILQKRGWTQGESVNDQGECCVIGALMLANSNWATYQPLKRIVNCQCIVEWNDAKGRTRQQVIDALRDAASLVMTNPNEKF